MNEGIKNFKVGEGTASRRQAIFCLNEEGINPAREKIGGMISS
jgi:hypothetical protein